MSERTSAIIAGSGVAVVAVGVAIWLARLGAWGLVAFTVVLASLILWMLVWHERHRPEARHAEDDADRRHGWEWSP